MIRFGDKRGDSAAESEYRSAIGRFLEQFAGFVDEDKPTFELKAPTNPMQTWDALLSNYRYISQQLESYLYRPVPRPDDDSPESDVNIVQRSDFERSSVSELFRRRGILSNEEERNRCLSELTQSLESEGLVRLLLFSSYLAQRVVLTRVEASNEADAFDIFDALNTTGEPLTALETCKPLIIQSENKHGVYSGSDSEYYWSKMELGLADTYSEPAKLQTEIKRLLTSFALYFDGYKLPQDLKGQRMYLRGRFQITEGKGQSYSRNFVRSVSEFSNFRLRYWDKNSIDRLSVSQYSKSDLQLLKLCLRFIADMNTSMAVPILARYWTEYGESDKDAVFVDATKAVAAFLALRRSVTGGTARIDSDFRKLLEENPKDGGTPFCLGKDMKNQLPSLEVLKGAFRAFLQTRRIGVSDRASWIARAKEIEFGNQAPQALCRFLLLAAAHDARPDDSHPGNAYCKGCYHRCRLKFL